MVRFIMKEISKMKDTAKAIYIPIWLDLLTSFRDSYGDTYIIYIPIWLDLLLFIERYLRTKWK